jgi:hypothetical protein
MTRPTVKYDIPPGTEVVACRGCHAAIAFIRTPVGPVDARRRRRHAALRHLLRGRPLPQGTRAGRPLMEQRPAPLVPAEIDLAGYEFMPLHGDRLFGSDFNARCSDAEWRAGVTLWWAAWKQVPAASLPDDDVALARLADLGRDVRGWRKLRANALYGFVACSDGRLYHPVLSRLAIEAWDRRIKDRERKARWRAGRDGTGTETGTDPVTETGTTATGPAGQDGGTGQGRPR